MASTNNDRDKIAEIKSRLDIVDVIGKDISLKHKGGWEYVGSVGVSGGSGESLKVDKHLQVWKDYKNGPGGDVYDWIGYFNKLDTRGAGFPEVLKIAADLAGVELEEATEEERNAAKEKADIHNLFTQAAESYHKNLTPEHYDYILQKWGITGETVDRLKIGYAKKGRNLKDLETTTLKKSGLVYVNGGMMGGEVFQGRIIFPYWKSGKVVYLIGRETEETPEAEREKGMKYKKLLVHKEGHEYVSPSVQNSYFYGEDSLRGSGYCIITEGVADCIALLQAGLPCISPVTVQFREKDHPKLLSLTKGLNLVYICNDNEANKAGLKGALSTAEALESAGIETRLIELPKPEGIDKIDIADYMKSCKDPSDSFLYLMQEESVRLWNYKLNQQVIKPSSTALERLRAFKKFISNDLHLMQADEWKVFVNNDVALKFDLKPMDIRTTVTDAFRNRQCKTEEASNNHGTFGISKFDLDSVTGRGEAYRILTEDFLKTYKPVITFADNGEIRAFDDGVYSIMEGSTELKITNYITEDLAFKKYSACLSPNHAESIIKKIKAKTHVLRSDVDKDPFKLAVKNGILDVKTGDLIDFRPDMYFTSKIDVEYNPDIKPVPEFIDYLNTTFEGVEWQIPVMQEIAGYCLYRAYPYEFLIFFTGDGRNGKGLFFQILGNLVGKHNISSIPLDEIVRKQSEFTLCDLYGKMINLCGEIGKTRISETRDIKMLTGKDDCRARFPYQKGFMFRNYAKMIFSMNEPPEIEDFTAGMKNRIKIYDFPNEFITGKNAISNLEEILTTPEALTGMLNWALEGLHRLLKNKGKLSDHRSAAQMGIIYEKKSRPMYYFVRDCIEEDPKGMVIREQLEEAYLNYAKRDNLPTLSKENIRKKLVEECNTIGIKTELKQVRKNQLSDEDQKNDQISARPRVYMGIRILPEEPKKPEQKNVTEYDDDREDRDKDLSKFSQARKDIIAFAKSTPYNGMVDDMDSFITDFMKANNGYKIKPGRQILTHIAIKAKEWGWTH